jgi:hypothetical protein
LVWFLFLLGLLLAGCAQGIIFGSVITLGGQGGTGSGLITAQLLFCAQLDGPTAGRFGGERPRKRRRDPVC